MWKDDCQLCWLLRSKTYTKAMEGSTTLYVAEIGTGPTNYDEILRHIIENIKLEEEDE